MIGILITGCSMHSFDLIRALRNNYDGEEFHVVGIDCNEDALLRDGVDAGYVVPRITEPDYLPTVLHICEKENVNIIFPYITAELPIMAENKSYFEDRGIKVSISSPEAIKMANDKVALAKLFPEYMPKQTIVHNALDCIAFATSVGYPNKLICCKLPNMCGGVGFSVVDEVRGRDITLFNKFGMSRFITLGMLTELVENTDETVILQEYEEGTDCSICGLADNGVLLHALGFEGLAMAYGSAMIARIITNESAIAITRKVVEVTGIDGNFCCDFILKDDGSVVLLEVNPRLTGTLPFIAEAGMNLPYMRVAQLLGKDVSGDENIHVNYGLRMNKRYESEYFV